MAKYEDDIMNIVRLYCGSQTVFSLNKLKSDTEMDIDRFPMWLDYQTEVANLRKVSDDLYVKKNYNPAELCNRIFTPSYISLNYVLLKEGVIFQYTADITAISDTEKELVVDDRIFRYRKFDDRLLFSPNGIEFRKEMCIATKERAVLDMLFLNDNFYFDNPFFLDFDLIDKILPIYKSRRMEERVKELKQKVQNELRIG